MDRLSYLFYAVHTAGVKMQAKVLMCTESLGIVGSNDEFVLLALVIWFSQMILVHLL